MEIDRRSSNGAVYCCPPHSYGDATVKNVAGPFVSSVFVAVRVSIGRIEGQEGPGIFGQIVLGQGAAKGLVIDHQSVTGRAECLVVPGGKKGANHHDR